MQPNREKRDKTIAKRQTRQQTVLLEKLRRMPIIQISLEQANIARSTYYRWRDEQDEFKKAADAAIIEGEEFITELSESKLLSLINKEHFPAVQLWLKAHHPKYTSRLELDGTINTIQELSPEQQALVQKALALASLKLTYGNTNNEK